MVPIIGFAIIFYGAITIMLLFYVGSAKDYKKSYDTWERIKADVVWSDTRISYDRDSDRHRHKKVEHYAKVNYIYDTIPHEGIPVKGLLDTPKVGEEITVLVHPKRSASILICDVRKTKVPLQTIIMFVFFYVMSTLMFIPFILAFSG